MTDTNAPGWSSSSAPPWSPAARPVATLPESIETLPLGDDEEERRPRSHAPLVALAVVVVLAVLGGAAFLLLRHEDKAPVVLTPTSIDGLPLLDVATRPLRELTKGIPVAGYYGTLTDGYFVIGGKPASSQAPSEVFDTLRDAFGVDGPERRVTVDGLSVHCAEPSASSVQVGPSCVWSKGDLLFAVIAARPQPVEDVARFLVVARRTALA